MPKLIRAVLTCFFAFGICKVACGGQIIHPWNATTEIVKAGEAFEVWFDADAGQAVRSVELCGPFNTVVIPTVSIQTGSWIYDRVSGNAYDTRVSVTVPPGTPEERYDLCVNTSAGDEISKRSVKVVRQFETEYSIMHISDTHMCQGAKIDGRPERLDKVSALVEMANIIGPEMVFVTGDLINNNMFPPRARSGFFYDGSAKHGLHGMHGFDAATFSVVGNHDFLEGEEPGGSKFPEKARFWNQHHGLQAHRFKYGTTRCMIVNTGWNGFDWGYQLGDHSSWLEKAGAGKLRVAAYHKSEMGIMGAWAKEIDLGLAMIGHNHHLAGDNPYELGGRPIQYYANSLRDHFPFNLYRIDGTGGYAAVNNLEVVENPADPPSAWRPGLSLSYARANDGTVRVNTATLVNRFDVAFPRARVRFVLPKGASYTVSQGTVAQAFDGDAVRVVDVRVAIGAKSTATIKITPSGEGPESLYPPAGQRTPSPGNTTYHIDPAHGDDANPGLDRHRAWRTFARVNQLQLAPGDRVEVVAPGAFDQTLALRGAGTAESPVEVRFAPGRYDFHPDRAYREAYQISNTNGDPDGRKAVGILLAGAKHIRLSGPGATIVYRGKMIEVCIDGSEDIAISGLSFDYHRPTVSEFQVETIGDGHVDLRIHKDSAYKIGGGSLIWLGEGWTETGGLGQDLDPATNRVHRVVDPLGNLSFEEIAPFHVRGRGKHRLKPGHIYQLRNPHRDCAGVFTRRSRNITWKDVQFRFLHGMGLVNQFSENLTFDTVSIAPDEASGRTTAAWADGIQVSGCKGRLLVKDCVFSGAHDDAINIHGTYLRVVERLPGNQVKVRFMHKQTFGFLAFNPGDDVEFMHADSMAGYQANRVTQSRLVSPTDLILTLEKPAPETIAETDVLENITWNPDVEIRGCVSRLIPTRGFLITSRGRVLVEDNEFLATHMSGILIDADARGWYESGGVRDVTIRRNKFVRCGEPVVSISPRTTVPNDAVHRHIRIEANEFELRGSTAVRAKGTKGLRVSGNTIRADGEIDEAQAIQTSDCAEVVLEGNGFRKAEASRY